jgi:hypothetical protein
MTTVFRRILRIRSLLEDASRSELEMQVMRTARIEQAIRGEVEAGRRQRAQGFAEALHARGINAPPAAAEVTEMERERRSLAAIDLELREQRTAQLQALARLQSRKMLSCREDFLARRKERQQVEVLVHAQMRIRKAQEQRREQHALDDWFQASRLHLRRIRREARQEFPE